MDPLSALSIAASVVQFVQFGGSLVMKTRQIYRNGSLPSNVILSDAVSRLDELSSQIRNDLHGLGGLGKLSQDSKALEAICEQCIFLSKELRGCLKSLEVDKSQRGSANKKWKSFRQAIKTIYSKEKVDGLAEQLRECREEMNTHLIAAIQRKADALALRRDKAVEGLTADIQKTIDAILENRQELQKDLAQQSKSILQSNQEHYAKTNTSILLALGEAQSIEIRLLRSLRFPAMDDRFVEISEANQSTFRWILEGVSERYCGDFIEWLEKGDGIYWINGKAGSGKSTLMRYIVGHSKTRQILETWAAGSQLEFSGFFFWNSGSKDQRSQTGLLRSLLYQALHRRPDLVRLIFPQEWADNSSAMAQMKSFEWSWSLRALKSAFRRWIEFAPTSSKMCFFIDGLDEYDGDHEEIATFFKTISSDLPHIKICISSRPWVVFDEAFKGRPNLRLQDLTSPDIEAYVGDELLGHSRMQSLTKANPTQAAQLSGEVVTKASGVFLWVILVVRSLLRGLRNQDEIEDLQKRLKELPSDLASLYTHMLDHVEPLYNEQASQIFQTFSIMVACEDEISSVQLETTISAIRNPPKLGGWAPNSYEQIESQCEWLDVRLKTRCAGLIEMSPNKHEDFSKVSYLHRTVREFLDTEDVRATMLKATRSDFEPYSLIIRARLAMIRQALVMSGLCDWQKQRLNVSQALKTGFVDTTLKYAKLADTSGIDAYIIPLDDFQKLCCEWWARIPKDVNSTDDFNPFDGENFLRAAMRNGLCCYVNKILKSRLFDVRSFPLLLLVIKEVYPIAPIVPWEVIEVLLKCGHDPNQVWQGYTLWQVALTSIHRTDWRGWLAGKSVDEQHKPIEVKDPDGKSVRLMSHDRTTAFDDLSRWAQVIKVMLKYGANPHAICTINHQVISDEEAAEANAKGTNPRKNSHKVTDIIADVFEKWLPVEGAELRQILEEQIEAQSAKPKRGQSVGGLPRAAVRPPARKQKSRVKGRKPVSMLGTSQTPFDLVERPKSAFEFATKSTGFEFSLQQDFKGTSSLTVPVQFPAFGRSMPDTSSLSATTKPQDNEA